MSKKRGMFSSDEETAPESSVQKDPEPEAKPAVAASEAPPTPPARELPMIALDVFCQASGKKRDQAKPFAGWAKRQGITSLTMPEWHEQWQKFQNRPV